MQKVSSVVDLIATTTIPKRKTDATFGFHLKVYFSILSQNEKLFDTLTSCLAIMITVFNENFRPQLVNKSSKDGPKRSRTMAL